MYSVRQGPFIKKSHWTGMENCGHVLEESTDPKNSFHQRKLYHRKYGQIRNMYLLLTKKANFEFFFGSKGHYNPQDRFAGWSHQKLAVEYGNSIRIFPIAGTV
jgi:hypothetical protein